ncbi:hypothetical protein D088_680055 [Salmonella enterica subsp. houtenae serovar 16:z4,z32:-- str. RKS3027]|nr:hypothetical protein D088_680055 [Salmonella enterica subsp. houtenae serovar 16:z4,z32:-- str. RKS3027]
MDICLLSTVLLTAQYFSVRDNSRLLFDRLRLCSKTVEFTG